MTAVQSHRAAGRAQKLAMDPAMITSVVYCTVVQIGSVHVGWGKVPTRLSMTVLLRPWEKEKDCAASWKGQHALCVYVCVCVPARRGLPGLWAGPRTRALVHFPVANGVQGPAEAHDVAYLHARRREQLVRWHNADCQAPQIPQMTLRSRRALTSSADPSKNKVMCPKEKRVQSQ